MAAPREVLDLVKSRQGVTCKEIADEIGVSLQLVRTIVWVLADCDVIGWIGTRHSGTQRGKPRSAQVRYIA